MNLLAETQEEVDSAKATGMEGMESIAKTLAAEDEDICMESIQSL